MSAPLVDRNTGDIIPASDHNDVKSYIEDGTYRTNTKALCIQGVSSVEANAIVDSSGYVLPVRVVSRGSGGIVFYASDKITQIAWLDESGNLWIKGNYLTL